MNEWLDFSDFIEKVQELIDLGLFEDAQGLLDQYSTTFSDEWEYYFLYSRFYAEQNKPRDAIPYLHKGLRFDPTNVDCLLGLFYAHAMMNQIRQAGKYLLRAEKYHGENEMVLSALIWYNTEINRLPTAIAYFDRIRAKGSTNPETFRNAGIAYDRAGSYDRAAECFRTALDLHPLFDEVRELLSDLYISMGKADKAVELYEQALAESPQNIRYLSRLIFCFSQNGQTEKAAAMAEESIRLYPNSPIGYIDLAYVHLNAGELDKAIYAAEKALDIAPLDAEGFRVRAIVFSEKGTTVEAEKAFDAALSLDRDNPEIMRDYYHHLRQVKNYQRMEQMVFKVIELEAPACAEDYWFLADYFKEKKDNLQALHFLGKAYKIRPGEYDLLPMIVEILLEHKHVRLSIKFLKRYVEHTGWNEVAARIAEHPRLQSPRMQEGLRFLHFFVGKGSEFSRYLFAHYLRQCIFLALGIAAAAASFPLWVLFGTNGLIGLALFIVAASSTMAAINVFHRKRIPSTGYERRA